jgi:hypothetical protein
MLRLPALEDYKALWGNSIFLFNCMKPTFILPVEN